MVLSCFLLMVTSAPVHANPNGYACSRQISSVSSAGERETRNTLNYFEQVREFFLKFNGHAPKEPAPVTIVIFGSKGI
jgi:hypothetical protein